MKQVKAQANDMQPITYETRHFMLRVKNDVTLDDVLHPGFFTNIGHEFVAGHTFVDVMSLDQDFYVRVFVKEIQKTAISSRLVETFWDKRGSKKAIKETDMTLGKDGLRVDHGGKAHKYRVLNGDAVVQFGYTTREQADYALELVKQGFEAPKPDSPDMQTRL